jgi:hypothetical protein
MKTPAIVAPNTEKTGASRNIIGDPYFGRIVSLTNNNLKKSYKGCNRGGPLRNCTLAVIFLSNHERKAPVTAVKSNPGKTRK